MGSDYRMLGDEIARNSHGDLCATLRRVKEMLERDNPVKWASEIKDIKRALRNASMFPSKEEV